MIEQISVRDVRNINKYNIIRSLMAQRDLSRYDIATINKISIMTVKNIVDDLLKNNILYEKKASDSLVGRKPSILNISDSAGVILTIDITSKNSFKYVVFNLHREIVTKGSYKCSHEHSFKLNLEHFFDTLKSKFNTPATDITDNKLNTNNTDIADNTDNTDNTEGGTGDNSSIDIIGNIIGIGVSVPGVYMQNEDRIYNKLIEELNEISLRKMLGEYFSVDNIIIDHDVKLAAIAEAMTKNEKADYGSLYYIFLGEGVGGALLINGEVYCGHNEIAGDIGQVLVDCNSDREYNLESILSTDAILMSVKHKLKKDKLNMSGRQDGTESAGLDFSDFNEILSMYANNEPVVRECFNTIFSAFARIVYNIIWLINPGIIVIGSSYKELGEIAVGLLKDKLSKLLESKLDTAYDIRISKYTENSSMIGSYEMVVNRWIESV